MQSDEPNQLNPRLTPSELSSALAGLRPSTCGTDTIHNRMLTNLNVTNRKSLLHLFNRLFQTGCVPESWKEAAVIPLLKPEKPKEEASSYRPIALTSCLSKVFERVIGARLSWLLESKGSLPRFQSGFRKRRSTIDNLVQLEHRIKKKPLEIGS